MGLKLKFVMYNTISYLLQASWLYRCLLRRHRLKRKKSVVRMMYMALTNFFFGGGGGGGEGGEGKGGGKGMGGLIISRFHLLYFSPSSSSTQKTENVCNFKVFKSDFETLPNQS